MRAKVIKSKEGQKRDIQGSSLHLIESKDEFENMYNVASHLHIKEQSRIS